ncbi:MAG: hypothetical protein JNJ89_13375 [Rubrivivax sp.]|nr:hypothetical protein [Rubrivivax sp.]
MNEQTKLWTNEPSGGFLVPVFPASPKPETGWMSQIAMGPIGDTWRAPRLLEWHSHRKRDRAPDITTLCLSGPCATPSIADALLGGDTAGFELVPFAIAQQQWVLMNCLRRVFEFDHASSHLRFLELQGHDRSLMDIKWINVTDPRAHELGMFTLGAPPFPRLFWTDALVQRYHGLGLKGLEFKHIGYIVPDAAHAVPEPAPPPLAASRRKYKGPNLSVAPLPAEQLHELELAGAEMRHRLRLSLEASAEFVLAQLQSEMRERRLRWSELSAEQREDTVLGLSAIYGDLLRSALGWSWVELRQGRSLRWIALLAPTGQHVFAPVPHFGLQIGADAPTTALLFNMLCAGDLPPAEPGQIVPIG